MYQPQAQLAAFSPLPICLINADQHPSSALSALACVSGGKGLSVVVIC